MFDRILSLFHPQAPVTKLPEAAESEKLEEAMPDTTALATVLHDAISYEEREATVAALWEVVFADGHEVPAEDALLHQLEALLGVSPEKSKELHDAAMIAARR